MKNVLRGKFIELHSNWPELFHFTDILLLAFLFIPRKLEVPMTWSNSVDIIRYKNPGNNGTESDSSGNASDRRSYVENSKVGESLLLRKFYTLSSTVVNHLLSDCDGLELDLPFDVTDEEREIILFPTSTFILGSSGTGKTTVLAMKLFQKEKLHRNAVEAYYGTKNVAGPCLIEAKESKESTMETDIPVLRQLFVTMSPKLCQAVKHHITRLTRCATFINMFLIWLNIKDLEYMVSSIWLNQL